jgi:hypothetical protein
MDSSKEIQKPVEDKPLFSNSSVLKDALEIISKAGILVVGGCYVSGLLILNLHLRQYGIFHLNFLQVEYVIVGALWTFLVRYALGLLIFTASRIKLIYKRLVQGERLLSPNNIAHGCAFLLFISFGLYINTLLSDSKIRFFQAVNFYIWGIILLNALGIILLVFTTSDIPYHIKKGMGQIFVAAASFRIFIYSALLVIFLSVYTLSVFPSFSPAFGGGRKQKVELILRAVFGCI